MRKMSVILLATLLALVMASPAWSTGGAETAPQAAGTAPEQPVDIRFGSMPVGSSWYVYAATISDLLEGVLPPGSMVEVVPQGGGIANPLTVEQGNAEVALANVATSKWAYQGIQMYEGRQAPNIRALVGGLNQVFAVVIVSNDFVKRTGIDSVEGLFASKARARFVTKPEGSTAPPVARMILDHYGVTIADIESWGGSFTQVSGGQIPGMMRDGQADVWIDVVPPGHPAVTEAMTTTDLTIVSLDEGTIAALGRFGLGRDTIAANTWPKQPNAVTTVNPGTVIIARADLPEEVAYQITKAICENKSVLLDAHASIAPFVPENGWRPENTGIPLHPGAERYYKERGWM